MRTDRELLQSAFDALDAVHHVLTSHNQELIDEIRARLAEPDPAPTAWLASESYNSGDALFWDRQKAEEDGYAFVEPLYRHPLRPTGLDQLIERIRFLEQQIEKKPMTDLLEAAKAVIDKWDRRWPVGSDVKIKKLRAAVELAENPPAEFLDWWHSNEFGNYGIHHAQMAWIAGQQAERERIRDIINSVEHVNCRDDDWYIACDLIMERIDDPNK